MGWIELIIYLFALEYICLSIMNQNSPNVRTALPRVSTYRPLGFLLTPGDFTAAMQRVTLNNRSGMWEEGDPDPGQPPTVSLCMRSGMCIEIEPQVWTSVISTPSQIWQGGKWGGGWGEMGVKKWGKWVNGVSSLTWEQGNGRDYIDCIINSFVNFLDGNRFRGFFMTFYWRHNNEYYTSYWLFTSSQ